MLILLKINTLHINLAWLAQNLGGLWGGWGRIVDKLHVFGFSGGVRLDPRPLPSA